MLFMAQGELSINMIFNVVLCVAVAVLLVTPTVGAALSGSRPAAIVAGLAEGVGLNGTHPSPGK